MNLRLTRSEFREDGIFGELVTEDGDFVAHTLEHAYPDGAGGWTPKVAVGTYVCERHPPNRLPYETFMLRDVPDFLGKPVSGILIHCGNFDQDSEGCLLVGKAEIQGGSMRMITQSKETFSELMALEDGVQTFLLLIA